MKCKLIREMKASPTHPEPRKRGTMLPVGEVIEHPQAWILVRNGCAHPEDDDCRIKADMTLAKTLIAERNYPAIDKGIVPEDRKAFFAGKMDGYNPDGSWKPGPNVDAEDVDDDDNEEPEEDLDNE